MGSGSADIWDGSWLPPLLCRPAYSDLWEDCIREGEFRVCSLNNTFFIFASSSIVLAQCTSTLVWFSASSSQQIKKDLKSLLFYRLVSDWLTLISFLPFALLDQQYWIKSKFTVLNYSVPLPLALKYSLLGKIMFALLFLRIPNFVLINCVINIILFKFLKLLNACSL